MKPLNSDILLHIAISVSKEKEPGHSAWDIKADYSIKKGQTTFYLHI